MPRIKKILAPTDFSDVSKLGVRYALEMARDASAEVVVYHAIEAGGEWKDNPSKVAAYHDMLEERRRLLGKFVADNFADCIDLVEGVTPSSSAHRTKISSRRRPTKPST
jgi:nucleotide-binding universal stress UspA family protein